MTPFLITGRQTTGTPCMVTVGLAGTVNTAYIRPCVPRIDITSREKVIFAFYDTKNNLFPPPGHNGIFFSRGVYRGNTDYVLCIIVIMYNLY